MNKSKESSSELIIASSDSAKELEFLKEALNKKSLFVLPPVACPRVFRVHLWWDTVFGAMFIEELTDSLRPICLVRHNNGTFNGNS